MKRRAPGTPRTSTDYWILRRDQIRCLTSAARHDMVDRLAAEGPLSVRELAHAIGMKPSALYHHLALLLKADLVVEAGDRTVNRRHEKLYATPSPRMRLVRALAEPGLRALMKEAVSALCRQMDRDFSSAADSPNAVALGPGRNLGFFRLVGQPDRKSLARINALLGEIGEILWTGRRPGEPLLALAWTLNPVRGTSPSPAGNRPLKRSAR